MADVIAFERARGRGRQSAEVEALRDARDELTALIDESRERQARVLAIVRRAERNLARGWSPANDLDELERETIRWGNQLSAAAAETAPVCPDGETVRHIGHGAAA